MTKENKNVGCVINTLTQITSTEPTIAISLNKDNYTNIAIKENQVFVKEGEQVWICTNCGHVHFGPAAPHVCPVCSKERGYFLNKMYFTIL